MFNNLSFHLRKLGLYVMYIGVIAGCSACDKAGQQPTESSPKREKGQDPIQHDEPDKPKEDDSGGIPPNADHRDDDGVANDDSVANSLTSQSSPEENNKDLAKLLELWIENTAQGEEYKVKASDLRAQGATIPADQATALLETVLEKEIDNPKSIVILLIELGADLTRDKSRFHHFHFERNRLLYSLAEKAMTDLQWFDVLETLGGPESKVEVDPLIIQEIINHIDKLSGEHKERVREALTRMQSQQPQERSRSSGSTGDSTTEEAGNSTKKEAGRRRRSIGGIFKIGDRLKKGLSVPNLGHRRKKL